MAERIENENLQEEVLLILYELEQGQQQGLIGMVYERMVQRFWDFCSVDLQETCATLVAHELIFPDFDRVIRLTDRGQLSAQQLLQRRSQS